MTPAAHPHQTVGSAHSTSHEKVKATRGIGEMVPMIAGLIAGVGLALWWRLRR